MTVPLNAPMSVVASSSKQPSESRVFPAVDSFVQRLANDSIRSKQIGNPSSSDELISILGEESNNVAVPKGTAPDSVFSNYVGVGGRAALTGIATQGHCAPVHTDTRDPRFTFGIRFDKPSSEPKSAGNFFFPNLQEASSDYIGVIVKQYTATIFLWQGKKLKHGSSIDRRGDKNISKTEIRSIGMVIGQKPPLFSETQMRN
jgi:hypothetical protein